MGIAVDRINVYLLHGFLGRPEDWDFLVKDPGLPGVEFRPLDYFSDPDLSPAHSFEEFALNLNARVRDYDSEHNILIGYSLGGRLALQALRDDSSLWAQAIFLSTNPGLRSPDEKKERASGDAGWSQRFLSRDWSPLMAEWNSQGVLHDSKEPPRLEKNYSRESLAQALCTWSLSKQPDQRDVVRSNVSKISWIVGETDGKFVRIAQEMKNEIPSLDVEVTAKASHRVFFDQPAECARILTAKIKKAANL